MKTARGWHTATVLQNGEVFMEGGDHMIVSEDVPKTMPAELYNPSTGQFSTTGGDQPIRSGRTSILLPDGRVLVTGGLVDGSTGLPSFLYDPALSTFTAAPNAAWMPGGTATLLSDGRVLLCGGFMPASITMSNAALYDPTLGTITAAGSPAVARVAATAIPLLNGQVLLVGGYSQIVGDNGGLTLGPALASAELFQP